AMAALRHRDQTGEGQHVDVALVDGLLFQSNGFPTAAAVGVPMERSGNEFSVAAPANNYKCRDGRVFAGVLLDSHWVTLANEIGRADLVDLKAPERLARREEVDGLLAAWCAEHTTAEVVDIFAELGLPAIRVNTYAEVIQEAHIASRDMMHPIELIDGNTVPIVGPAAKFSRTPTTIRKRAAGLGENNADVFGELGIDQAELQRLKAEGVI
ncbi:MAG: CoA transferase, partial [Gammaproteobacteria bacterium]|nr:CoA transferase [Gammaproteobacteria bacterium]